MKKKNHEAVKKNLSSTQVLKTLRVLMEDNYSMSQLIEKLNKNEKEPVFNNSVISKYINTCRYCGIKIPKIQNKYFVVSIPFGMNLSNKECWTLKQLQNNARLSLSVRNNKKFLKFMMKLSKYSNKEIIRVEEETKEMTCTMFEKAAFDGNKIRLMYKNGLDMECYPVRIDEEAEEKYLIVDRINKERKIPIERISGLEVLKERFLYDGEGDTTVIFKLTGELALRYELRNNERILNDNRPNSITIMNKGENSDLLISRLMRYNSLCEIQTPKYVRDEMKQAINNTLANYGE